MFTSTVKCQSKQESCGLQRYSHVQCTLPAIDEWYRHGLDVNNDHHNVPTNVTMTATTNIMGTHATTNTCPHPNIIHVSNNIQETTCTPNRYQSHLQEMNSQLQVIKLESKCELQSHLISQLQHENSQLKIEIAQLKRKRNEKSSSSKKKKGFTFSAVTNFDESSSDDDAEVDPNQMVVTWRNKSYYLVGAFKSICSRTRVLVNFVPSFEKDYPEKECKMVLNSEEFKLLVKENAHLFKRSKHTWRVSLFSSDFYQYVKAKS